MSKQEIQRLTGTLLTNRDFVDLFAKATIHRRRQLLVNYDLTDNELGAFAGAKGETAETLVTSARQILIDAGIYTDLEI